MWIPLDPARTATLRFPLLHRVPGRGSVHSVGRWPTSQVPEWTGLIALALAGDAGHVVGRDISDGMIEQARSKAAAGGIENVEFGYGEFRDPQYDGDVDVVVSNFALHHLPHEEKREAIEVIAELGPRRFALGDAMFFGSPDPEETLFGHGVDAATVGMLVDVLTDAGFVVTAVERVHNQVGVLVAEQSDEESVYDPQEDQ